MSAANQTMGHPPIYFVTVDLKKQVHMIGLGFTTHFYMHACAQTPQEAEQVTLKWLAQSDCEVRKVTSGKTPAVQQDIRTYTVIEQIINLPKQVLESEYARRQYPEEWRRPGRYVEVDATT